MLLYFSIIALSLICLHLYVRYGAYRRAINKIPGPPGLPIIGNILDFNKSPEKIWDSLQELMSTYYPYGKLWLFNTAVFVTMEPDDLKVLLSDKVNISKGYMYKYLHLFTNLGLITSTADQWQMRRKIIMPAFHTNVIKKCIEITSEQGDQLIKSVKAEGDESVQSLLPVCSNLTLSIIIEAAMGVNFKSVEAKVHEYKDAIDSYLSSVAYRASRPYIQDWMLQFYNEGRKILSSVKTLHGFSDKIIEERKEYHNQTKQQSFQDYVNYNPDTYEEAPKKTLAMLDLLLLAQKEDFIDDQGIKEEVDTFTATGYDTSRMAMVYVLMLLAENKEAQELARAEADRILDGSNGEITRAEIQQMEYIERCVKESLRLFPSAPNIGRTLTKDVQLKHCTVPAGTEIFIPIFSVHRDPKYWPEPLKFDPDRFLPEIARDRHPFTYMPFSHGPRSCIGQQLAIAQMKSLTARILHNFHLEPVDRTEDLKFKAHVVLTPTIKPRIKFIKRQTCV